MLIPGKFDLSTLTARPSVSYHCRRRRSSLNCLIVLLVRHFRRAGADGGAFFTYPILVASSLTVAGGISIGAIIRCGYDWDGIAIESGVISLNAPIDVDLP